jgi:putative SOS response-associated peptidase YedK
MCNLYSITTNQAAIIAPFRVLNRYVGNLAPMPGVFPDYQAPIVRNGAGGRELATARWGMPSSSKALMDATKKRAEKLQAKGKTVDFKELLRMEPDGGSTNIRDVKSKHWTRWLGVENRCVVPFNSFSEFNKAEGGDIWFALDETRPLACFAGIWTNWTSVRKDIACHQEQHDRHRQHEIIEFAALAQGDAEDLERRHRHAGGAAGQHVGMNKRELHDRGERQRSGNFWATSFTPFQ